MVRGKKTRRPTNLSSPRCSPSDKDNKRVRHNRTLDGFLSLASDTEDDLKEAEEVQPQALEDTTVSGNPEVRPVSTGAGTQSGSTAAPDDEVESQSSETTIPMGNESTLTTTTASTDSTSLSTSRTPLTLLETNSEIDQSKDLRRVDQLQHLASNDSPYGDRVTYKTNLSALIPLRPNVQRLTLRIHVNPSKTAEKELIDALRRIVAQFKTIDSSMLIYRWADNDETASNLSSHLLLPNTIGRLRHYFPRLTPRDAGGEVYTSVRIGISQPWSEFRNRANPWLQQHKHGLWPCSVQAETTTCLGWLLYSSRDMDLASLKTELERLTSIEIGLRWRPIAVGRSKTTTERPRAVHIEVDKQVETIASPLLRKIYSSTATSWPNGVRLRLVPELGVHMSSDLRAKVERLRLRQQHFTAKVIRIQNWEMAAIDFRFGENKCSLRELLMAIPSRGRQSLSLFHSVDRQWNGDGHTFTVLPILEDEARSTIAGLLPLLRAQHPHLSEFIDRCFTDSAVERAAHCRWDLEAHSLITDDDAVIDEVLLDMDEFLLEAADLSQAETLGPQKTNEETGLNLLGGENDSVSTLQSKRNFKERTPPQGRTVETELSQVHESTSPPASTISSLTVEERVLSLETRVELSVATIMEELRLIRQEQGKPRGSLVGHQQSLVTETDPQEGVGLGP